MPRSPNIKTVIDPLAYWVGPVREVYGSDPAKSTAVDLSKYIDRQRKTVRSITGEIETGLRPGHLPGRRPGGPGGLRLSSAAPASNAWPT